jgi:hypothetical protein
MRAIAILPPFAVLFATLLSAASAHADDAPPTPAPAATGAVPPIAPPLAADAHEPATTARPSGLGESCRARADCAAGLACVRETCMDESSAVGEREEVLDDFQRFSYEGVHGFAGLLLAGGPSAFHSFSRSRTSLFGNFAFSFRGGVTLGRLELAVELSPMTHWMITQGLGPHFQVSGTVGYLLPMVERGAWKVSWPLRIGAGALAGNTARPLFEARADLVGLQIAYGHAALDLYLPSVRTFADVDSSIGSVTVAWAFGAGATYFF